MNPEKLRQIHYLNKEVNLWQRELERLKECSLVSGQAAPGTPSAGKKTDRVGNLAVRLCEAEQTIRDKLAEIRLEKEKIMEYIGSVDDSYMRQVIYLRNVNCLKWEEIADELGGSGDSHRMAYRRFF